MDSKIFNIPFRTKTSASDFSCKDGETEISSSDFDFSETSPVPVPRIEFGVVRDVLHGWHINPDVYPAKTLIATDPGMEYWNKLAAKLLVQFQSEAASQSLYVAPFYAMAAWKTYDGEFLSPSTPVLLIPNSEIPVVTTAGDLSNREVEFRVAGALGRLHYKLTTPETMREQVGRVESLVIFASEPLQKYADYDYLLPLKQVATENYCEELDPATWSVNRRRICTETLPIGWVTSLDRKSQNPLASASDVKFMAVEEVALSVLSAIEELRMGVMGV